MTEAMNHRESITKPSCFEWRVLKKDWDGFVVFVVGLQQSLPNLANNLANSILFATTSRLFPGGKGRGGCVPPSGLQQLTLCPPWRTGSVRRVARAAQGRARLAAIATRRARPTWAARRRPALATCRAGRRSGSPSRVWTPHPQVPRDLTG